MDEKMQPATDVAGLVGCQAELKEKINAVSRRSLDGSVVMSSEEWNGIVELVEKLLTGAPAAPDVQGGMPEETINAVISLVRDAAAAHLNSEFSSCLSKIRKLLTTAPHPEAVQEPVGWQFYQDGKWWNGDDRIKDHKKNTQEAGFRVRDMYAAPTAQPVQGGGVPEWIQEISANLKTQDNRITADPLFVVFQKREIVTHEDFDYDRISWGSCDGEAPAHIQDELNELYDDVESDYFRDDEITLTTDDGTEIWQRAAIKAVDEFVTACFTEAGAKAYLENNGHNLRQPFIYVTSLYRNEEMKQLRDWLYTHPHNGEQGGEWFRCGDRLPELRDADWEGCVWYWSPNFKMARLKWQTVREWSFQSQNMPEQYWKPTGLTRPQPPKSKEDES